MYTSCQILWPWFSAIPLPSRLEYLGNLSSFKIGRKMWWECCASQSQLLCLKIPLVNQYLSKHDVEECSLIPNSQHCLSSMVGSLVLSNLIFLPKMYWGINYHASVNLLSWEPILSEEPVSEKKAVSKNCVQKRLPENTICSANESKQSGTNTSKWIFQINKKEII